MAKSAVIKEPKAGSKAGERIVLAVAGELIPQAHGGAIYQGTPKNIVPGTGRPPSAIRATMRQHLDEEVLGKLLEQWRVSEGKDTLQVAEFLAKHGLGENSVPKSKVLALIGVWREILARHELPETLLSELGAATTEWELRL